MDNLESQTYEVFEKDPIKYSQYQQVRPRDTAITAPVKTFQSTIEHIMSTEYTLCFLMQKPKFP